MVEAEEELKEYYPFFGYGYFNDVKEAIPNVPVIFYAFHFMVMIGGFLLVYLLATLFMAYKREEWLYFRWKNIAVFPVIAFIALPLVYICHQCGWIVAEMGRQPWTIQDILPVQAAISSLSASQVITTFCIFAVLFTILLCAEVGIMVRQIRKGIEEKL